MKMLRSGHFLGSVLKTVGILLSLLLLSAAFPSEADASNELAGHAYAILSQDGSTFYFIRSTETPVLETANQQIKNIQGTTYTGKIYDVREDFFYDYENKPAWYPGSQTDELRRVKSVIFVDTIRPVSTYSYFSCFYECESFDIRKLDTSLSTNMHNMFACCRSTPSLDVSHFDTSHVKDMNGMFGDCELITSLDVSGFDTSNVTSMSGMFFGCQKLTGIDVSGFDTSKVTDMSGMFGDCIGFSSLDVTNFDTSNVRNMRGMFLNCRNLKNLNVSSFTTEKTTDMSFMFSDCRGLQSIDITGFDTSAVTDFSFMFQYMTGVRAIDLSHMNTQNADKMSGMFNNCSGLKSLDVSGFNTSKVSSYGLMLMFHGCSSLTSLDVSNFDTSGAVNVSWMFADCTNLRSLTGLDRFNTENVKNFNRMFRGCKSLPAIDVSKFKTSSAVEVKAMFEDCSSVTSLDTSNFDTSNVTDFYKMFYNCSSLQHLDVSGFNTEKADIMLQMFSGCRKLANLDVYNFNTSSVTDFGAMFRDCTSLKNLDVSGFNTTNAINMFEMFRNCSSLTSLDVTGFDTGNVKSMRSMFAGCSSLTSLDVSGFSTGNVTSMYYMFSGCKKLTSLDVTSFDTSKAKDMRGLFSDCTSLRSIDVSNFDISDCDSPEKMFYNCSSLNSLDLSAWDMSSCSFITDMLKGTNLNEITLNNTSVLKTIYRDAGLPELPQNDLYTGKWTTVSPTNQDWAVSSYGLTMKYYAGRSNEEKATYYRQQRLSTDEYVTRIFGRNRYLTSVKLADSDWLSSWKNSNGTYETLIIASGKDFPDALSGSCLAAKKQAPIILVSDDNFNEISSFVRDSVSPDATIYILGGTFAVSENTKTMLRQISADFNIKRLGGIDRYATDLQILKEVNVPDGDDILVATGYSYADSLSASSTGKAIIVVGGSLTEEQKEFFRTHKKSKIYLLGGTGAVSDQIKREIAGCLGSSSKIQRITGKNRYETSINIAKTFWPSSTMAIASYGMDFPDGLCAGPVGYQIGAPVLLVTDENYQLASNYAATCNIRKGIITGGPSLISDSVANKIFHIAGTSAQEIDETFGIDEAHLINIPDDDRNHFTTTENPLDCCSNYWAYAKITGRWCTLFYRLYIEDPSDPYKLEAEFDESGEVYYSLLYIPDVFIYTDNHIGNFGGPEELRSFDNPDDSMIR